MKSSLKLCRFILLLCISLSTANCSSLSLPSLRWSSSSARPDPDATALYQEAIEHLNNKNYTLAIDRLKKVKTEFPFAPEAQQAELKIGEAYYLNKQYGEAIAALQEFRSFHPTNPEIPFVLYYLGLSHLDQFTAIDRDQKTTELAKGYFETILKDHRDSPYAPLAQQKLAKCLEYLAEHEFAIASFYLNQKKYPAARERLDEIIRRYKGTPTAVKALYHLGETYRLEKNTVKAALAYSALVQHYPQSELAKKAQVQLAEVLQEKQDPLALLLMRDGPPKAPPVEVAETRPLNELNLVAKKDVVYEEGGREKGFFRRVMDKINPFADSDGTDKQTIPASKPTADNAVQTTQSGPGFFGSMLRAVNPFAKSEKPSPQATPPDAQVTAAVDDTLSRKGFHPAAQPAPPAADLDKIPVEPAPAVDPANAQNVLRDVDAKLNRGDAVADLPPPPEAHPAFAKPLPQQPQEPQGAPSAQTARIIGNVDEKLRRRGIDPAKTEMPLPTQKAATDSGSRPETRASDVVELDVRIEQEKGPLFAGPASAEQAAKPEQPPRQQQAREAQEPTQQLPAAAITGAPRIKETPLEPQSGEKEGALQGALDQLKKDAADLQKLLNPLAW
ncbi:MAG TPA: outer membrane protein assembly factor BamD [Candidatus Acidoferrales bacterium]|nr:outer membrane protein assembly factor BamD [Candidatus Acidoferrales bacterium]